VQQPFYYGDGRRAMPCDFIRLSDGSEVEILSLWFDRDDNTDATVITIAGKLQRVNLDACTFLYGKEDYAKQEQIRGGTRCNG
jgi:hypothetical protein